MYSVTLNFSFLESGKLKLYSQTSEIIDRVKQYYSLYVINSTDEEMIDCIKIKQIGGNDYQIDGSFYINNPKMYFNYDGLKLITDIVEDYIGERIKTQTLSKIILHASSVICGESSIVFIGATESGKSTATLKLLHQLDQSQFLSDDFLTLSCSEGQAYIEPYYMPLHIRTGSLPFNQYYECEAMGPNQFYVKIETPTSCDKKIKIDRVFLIQFSDKNSLSEITGTKKIFILLNNIKYYSKEMIEKCGPLFNNIALYSLSYADDAFLVQTVKNYLGLKKGLNNLIPRLIELKLRKKEIKTITVQGNSMYPTLCHNQIILIEYPNPNEIQRRDIVVYKKFTHITIHRIIDIQYSGNRYLYQTKGDNNPYLDSYLVSENEILARVVTEENHN